MASPFLSQAEDRELRDSDTETESEEEWKARINQEKFLLSAHSALMLAEVTFKPLKNTKRRQLLEHFPLPAECDQAYLLNFMTVSPSSSLTLQGRRTDSSVDCSSSPWTRLGLFSASRNS